MGFNKEYTQKSTSNHVVHSPMLCSAKLIMVSTNLFMIAKSVKRTFDGKNIYHKIVISCLNGYRPQAYCANSVKLSHLI